MMRWRWRRLLARLRRALAWVAFVSVIAAAFVIAPRLMAWVYGISIAIAVPAVIYFWWWMHTWPLHAWRDKRDP